MHADPIARRGEAGTLANHPHLDKIEQRKINCTLDQKCDTGWRFIMVVGKQLPKSLHVEVAGIEQKRTPLADHFFGRDRTTIELSLTTAQFKPGKQKVAISHKGKSLIEAEIELSDP